MTTTHWRDDHRFAALEERLDSGVVRCHLSPRNCTLRPGQRGFCNVRENRDGRLVTLNYGKGVVAAEERIETEAVFHYAPGERILSLGNLGCMLNCDYCHNWRTSQAKHVIDEDVVRYTPEGVVDMALRHGIRMLSWTYNDPVVWHEFIVDTSRLAQQHGIRNLYKSAFFITPEAIEELLPSIDIFSVSLKSMDPAYYRKLTKGRLEPVLDGIRQVHQAGKHVEISTLMVTDVSDDEKTARDVATFCAGLSVDVPLHFVRYHPDYKMATGERTPIPRLIRARDIAREVGVRHVYLGNVYDDEVAVSRCHACAARLVERFGLNARPVGLDDSGACRACGADNGFHGVGRAWPRTGDGERPRAGAPGDTDERREHRWRGDVRAAHCDLKNAGPRPAAVLHRPLSSSAPWTSVVLAPGERMRLLLSKADDADSGFSIAWGDTVRCEIHEVFDRAHYPTVPLSQGRAEADRSPLPIFRE